MMEHAIADMVLAELGIENLQPMTDATRLGVPELSADEISEFLRCSAPRLAALAVAGVEMPLEEICASKASARPLAKLWGGMGAVYEVAVPASAMLSAFTFVVKRVNLRSCGADDGEQRKRASYFCEAAFYTNGHVERLSSSGCSLPLPLHVDRGKGEMLTICMTKLEGKREHAGLPETRSLLAWLARLHAEYWGSRADSAVAHGLQSQGCFWHLDATPKEYAKMPTDGWEGRLRLAARSIDQRLKMDAMQTICHGDAKGDNVLFARVEDRDGAETRALVYDFQWCGRAPPTQDVAYVLSCTSCVPDDEEALLLSYHTELSELLRGRGDEPPSWQQFSATLALSYCDLARWMSGWGWWGHVDLLRGKVMAVLEKLDEGIALPSEEAYMDAVTREYPIS